MEGITFKVGSGIGLISRGSGSDTFGRSRVPDLRERGGDKEAILERSTSSGLGVALWIIEIQILEIEDYEGEDYRIVRLV